MIGQVGCPQPDTRPFGAGRSRCADREMVARELGLADTVTWAGPVASSRAAAGKPVFHVEYELGTDQFCPGVKALGFSSMRKKLDLDAWRQAC